MINFIFLPLMLSEGGEENSIYHIIKHAGNKSATSSIIKSGQKDTEASIHGNFKIVNSKYGYLVFRSQFFYHLKFPQEDCS